MPATKGPSVPRKRSSRAFKERRALMACQRCRHLKKGCKQEGQRRCQRCRQSDLDCIYLDVASDPTAPRPPGSTQPTVVPDSPISSPSEPPSPTFEIYLDQGEGSQYAPHLTRLRNDRNPILNTTLSIPTTNAPTPRPSIFTSQSGGQSPSFQPIESFPDQPLFDTTFPYIHDNGIYDVPDLFAQPPPDSFTPRSRNHDQDIIDPLYPPHYLRSRPHPPPLSQSNVQAFNFAMASNLQPHCDLHQYMSPLIPIDLAPMSNNSDYYPSLSASTLNHSPISPFDDHSHVSSFDLP